MMAQGAKKQGKSSKSREVFAQFYGVVLQFEPNIRAGKCNVDTADTTSSWPIVNAFSIHVGHTVSETPLEFAAAAVNVTTAAHNVGFDEYD